MKNITIQTPDPKLLRHTHSDDISGAECLVRSILTLEEVVGHTVTRAVSSRASVPNSYWRAWSVNAPYWEFDGTSREVTLVDGTLETRPHGARIPCHFWVSVAVATPKPEQGAGAKFRCQARTETVTEFTS